MAYIPPTAHATLLATLRRERRLPAAGQVLVEPHKRVEAADVVARTTLPERVRFVDVARALRLPPEKADAALLKRDGEAVKAGEPIAERRVLLGLVPRRARAPVNGRLVAAAGGTALVEAASRPFELRAGLPGTVVTILQSQGVIIETTGALLGGVWGNGRDDFAPLRLAGAGPAHALTTADVEVGMRGAILAAGVLAEAAVLKKLAEVRVRGLVLGSAAGALVPQLEKLDVPVLVVEGFGPGGFSPPAMALLSANAGREAWLNAARREPFSGRRPELIIPLPPPGQPPPPLVDGDSLAPGKRVRILRGPAAGRVGTVAALSERPAALPSGLRARVATVALASRAGNTADGEPPVRVALANLELLE
jgi:hypothetical protein